MQRRDVSLGSSALSRNLPRRFVLVACGLALVFLSARVAEAQLIERCDTDRAISTLVGAGLGLAAAAIPATIVHRHDQSSSHRIVAGSVAAGAVIGFVTAGRDRPCRLRADSAHIADAVIASRSGHAKRGALTGADTRKPHRVGMAAGALTRGFRFVKRSSAGRRQKAQLRLGAALLLFAVTAPGLGAQVSRSRTYVGIDAGLTHDPSQSSVRSSVGFSAGGLVGQRLSPHTAAELRLGLEQFAGQTQIPNPGGCLGAVPCVPLSPERIRIVTLALDGVASDSVENAIALLLVGAGARYVKAQPGPSELRPYGELGTGLGISIGAATIGVEVRYQLAVSGAGMPRWTLPLSFAVRF